MRGCSQLSSGSSQLSSARALLCVSTLKQGLCVLGVADALKQHGSLLRPLFCNDADVNLTSG